MVSPTTFWVYLLVLRAIRTEEVFRRDELALKDVLRARALANGREAVLRIWRASPGGSLARTRSTACANMRGSTDHTTLGKKQKISKEHAPEEEQEPDRQKGDLLPGDQSSTHRGRNGTRYPSGSRSRARQKAPETHFTAQAENRTFPETRINKTRLYSTAAALQASTDDAKVFADLKVNADEVNVSEEWQCRYRNDAHKYWDHFFQSKRANRYTGRGWHYANFTELIPHDMRARLQSQNADASKATFRNMTPSSSLHTSLNMSGQDPPVVLLEIGCAAGNAVMPLLQANPGLVAFACDISLHAVEELCKQEEYMWNRCRAFACDVSREEQPSSDHRTLLEVVPRESVDFITLQHVMCAIDPSRHRDVLERLRATLKPEGSIFFRDQGIHDLRQIRFPPGHRLGNNTYVRGDGRLSVFFELESLKALFAQSGFTCIHCAYFRSTLRVCGGNVSFPRVKVQGLFQKTAAGSD